MKYFLWPRGPTKGYSISMQNIMTVCYHLSQFKKHKYGFSLNSLQLVKPTNIYVSCNINIFYVVLG